MSRDESDREDLMAEAKALVRRIEFAVPAALDPVVAGFRANGSLSIYFGPDPVFQFDPQGRLRRAFCRGMLYRTQGSTLAQLERNRTAAVTELIRVDLAREELDRFLNTVVERLLSLRNQLVEGTAQVTQQLPTDDERLVADLVAAVDGILNAGIPLAPAIPGKR